MPLLESSYRPAFWFRNGHWATMYASKLRRLNSPYTSRERLELPDGDFLDLDLIQQANSSKYCLLLHGLEGDANRVYMKGAANTLGSAGWNVVAVNYRGCSGSANRKYYTYNAGKTDDLEFIIDHLISSKKPERIAMVGFSLGGNLLLKYLSTQRPGWDRIEKAVAISAPLDLKETLLSLNRRENWVYRTYFLLSLKAKLKEKLKMFPDKLDPKVIREVGSLLDFDNIYTAPAHGFKDAFEYYAHSSCGQYLPKLKVPTLLLNAYNDSFLTPESYPVDLAKGAEFLYLETPEHGGHVGFVTSGGVYYSEQKMLEFLND